MNREMIISSCHGIIEKVSVEKGFRVYEWESLFIVKMAGEQYEEIRVGISGRIDSLEVAQGDEVIPGMVLAYIIEDMIASGSD